VDPIAPTKRTLDRRTRTLGFVFHTVKLVNVAKLRVTVT